MPVVGCILAEIEDDYCDDNVVTFHICSAKNGSSERAITEINLERESTLSTVSPFMPQDVPSIRNSPT